jgi:N-acetylmuramoyl-L-alanine amidase
MPCVIVEPFFIDSDASLELANHKFEELAEAYVTGIKQFIKGDA